MTTNYGKRNPGGLTAASPGDTLYIPLSFYNDSGASISIGSTLAVTDVELFKNGGVTERATDSGYSVLGDTGNFDNRTGFKGISVQIFNTADDTGFYDEGSAYWVAVDSVTVDGRTVRFWPAVFELGEPRANVVQINSDTGAAAHIAQLGDEYDTGRLPAEASASLDTGAVSQAVWQGDASRTLTGWAFDTGLQQAITRLDTGINETIDRILSDTDTGIQPLTLAQIVDGVWDELDTGHADTGTYGRLRQGVNITKINNISVTGTGDTGTGDTWGPA